MPGFEILGQQGEKHDIGGAQRYAGALGSGFCDGYRYLLEFEGQQPLFEFGYARLGAGDAALRIGAVVGYAKGDNRSLRPSKFGVTALSVFCRRCTARKKNRRCSRYI